MKDHTKEEIADKNALAAGYIKNTLPLKQTNMEVCHEMVKHQKLHYENQKMTKACEEIMEEVEGKTL